MTKTGSILLVCTVYLLGHGFILLTGNTLYWDGHALLQLHQTGGLIEVFRDAGFPIFGYLHETFISFSPYASRVASFLFHLLSGLVLFKILDFGKLVNLQERLFITCLFLVLPFNFARISIINLQYAVSLLCFMIAWLAWCHYERQPALWLRLLAIVLFTLSFTTQSLLMFFVWPFLHAFRVNGNSPIKFGVSRFDFLLLPPLFFVLNKLLFPPTGVFNTYNAISLNDSLFSGPFAMIWSAFIFLDINLFVAVGMIIVSITLFRLPFVSGKCSAEQEGTKMRAWLIIGLGLTIAVSAVLPYLLVNKLPLYQGWTSRHQLLLPLGVAIVIFGFIRCFDRTIHTTAFGIVTGLCLAASASGYWQYLVDSLKQDAFVYSVADNSVIRNGTFFPVVDDVWYLNAFGRLYNLEEYDSLLKRAFGDGRNRLALDRSYGQTAPRNNSEMAYLFMDARNNYMVSDESITVSSINCELRIAPGPAAKSLKKQIILTYKRLLSSPDYPDEVKALLKVKCVG